MIPEAALSVLVGASSLLVAGAATYSARRVSTAVDKIEAADRRSRENREMLTGERDGTRGVYPWLEELDREVADG